eukprot:Gregarina_sp_Pseudo_9__5343@NODE_635_length_2449_cov_4_912863_g599_i0_p1_GENE_NODE_635_length_2449_cov_4_912863_g599_i0NODE_635_length_2449_cov_4_912863_g599_i0_p1_ORF_typecomplete_len563_score142_99Pkinase/PF00069_25/1_6e06Kinaselike/PF14531_6/0_01_NODE_635_length_2449_cov_4_912863_g599_i06942382
MGCLLYVLVGGTYPFNGEALDDQILRGEYSFEGERFRAVTQECKALIMGMLRIDPHTRFTLDEIEAHPWMQKPMPAESPPLPIIQQTTRSPIIMNVGPTIVGARNAEADPTKDVVVPVSPPSSRTRSKIDHAVELFNASELLDLLGNTFYRFHAAYVAFRMHRKISSEIQAMLLEIKDLTMQSTKVFKGFYFTCQQVIDLIADVTQSVHDGDAGLAVALLDQLKEWVQDTLKDGVDIRERFGAAVRRATLLVAYSRDLNAPWHHENWKSASMKCLRTSGGQLPMLKEDAEVSREQQDISKYSAAREDIFQDIQAVDKQTATQDRSAAVANRLLDFLFVSPTVVPLNPTSSTAFDMLEPAANDQEISSTKNADESGMKSSESTDSTKETTRPSIVPSPEMTEIIPTVNEPDSSVQSSSTTQSSSAAISVPHQAPTGVTAEWRKAQYLMKGLEELQRVSDILEQCSAFWDNLDLTLGLVQKFKDQIVIVLKHSTKPASAARLAERLKQYEGFWVALGDQCDRYVKGASSQSDRMKSFVSDFNNSVVKNNCAASIYTMTQVNSAQ